MLILLVGVWEVEREVEGVWDRTGVDFITFSVELDCDLPRPLPFPVLALLAKCVHVFS